MQVFIVFANMAVGPQSADFAPDLFQSCNTAESTAATTLYPTTGKLTKEQAMANSEHIFRTTDSVVQCSECLSKVHLNSPDFYSFVRTPCIPAIRTHACVSIVGQIRIRNQHSHPTHDMYSFRGIQYCNKCGYMVKRRMQNLTKPCNGSDRRSAHGRRVLESIARHELPPGVECWPVLRPHGRSIAE